MLSYNSYEVEEQVKYFSGFDSYCYSLNLRPFSKQAFIEFLLCSFLPVVTFPLM